MLEKFKNKKVEIIYTSYAHFRMLKGIVTNIDENFIELDNNDLIAIKYILTIKSI